MAMLTIIVKTLGVLSLSSFTWKAARLFWIYFLHPSGVPKYLHASPASWALVTGASDGIGFELAQQFLARGFNVLIHGRNERKLLGIQTDLMKSYPGRSVKLIVADASKSDVDFQAIHDIAKDVPGKLTVLVNNVGGMPTEPRYLTLGEIPTEDIDQIIAINARFPTHLTAALMPLLEHNKPSLIINCGSFGGVTGTPYIATYAATKAYVHALTKSLRFELASERVQDIEVIGPIIGNTFSATNRANMAGSTITAAECAKSILDRVGCGETLVTPHWRHLITGSIALLLPESLVRILMAPAMRDRRMEEQKMMAEQKKSG